MHSTDAARRNARRRPDLNINTSSGGRSRDAVPQTPPSRSKPPVSSKAKNAAAAAAAGGRALRGGASTIRDATDIDSFLDSIDSIDMSNKENDRPDPPPRPNPRDSHDLSLSPRQVTRDSLVTNMLLSLDQLSMGQLNTQFGGGGGGPGQRMGFDDPAIFSSYGIDETRTMTFNSRSGRSNGHGYSYSSDFEGADDSSRISSQPSRGRRSNSSSGFQSSLGRINSMRETSQRNPAGTSRPLHSRGGKGSKSSSTNSIDAGYAQVLSSQRWAHGFGGRSSSFDYGPARAPTTTSTTTQPMPPSQPPWHIEFSNTFFNDEYEAAPTPTVPAGPRRLAAVPSLPVLPPPEPAMQPPRPPGTATGVGMERQRSTRSSRSATVGRKADSKFNGRDVPPVPAFDLDSAPAPHIGYEKSKEPMHSSATTPASQPTKDKPGFFRRMFGGGSSRNNSSSQIANSPSSSSAFVSSTSVETAGSRSHHIASQMKSPSSPPSRDSHHSSTTHTLQKKTSSFFRRRKQSFSENEPPPLPVAPAVPPLAPAVLSSVKLPPKKEVLSPKPEPSPITSLRRAMDPFLHGSPTTPNEPSPLGSSTQSVPVSRTNSRELLAAPDKAPPAPPVQQSRHEEDRQVRSFSPEYERSPKAVIRTVEPEETDPDEDDRSVRLDDFPQRVATPTRDPPAPPVNGNNSFLADNSDSENSPPRNTNAARSASHDQTLKPNAAERPARSPSPSMTKAKSSPNLRLSRHLSPSSSFEDRNEPGNLGLPIEGIRANEGQPPLPETPYKAAHGLPSLKIEGAEGSPKVLGVPESMNHSTSSIDEPHFVVGDPTEDDKQKAQKIFDGNEDFIQKEKAAAWMGEEGPVRQRTLRAYMDLFDFKNQSIVNSLRMVCGRLILKAETQQIDRILVSFSRRWCDCNPNHGFKATDTIHTICYSIMLLNTDLHLADVEQKMTRSQFVKNTMTTIRQSIEDSTPGAFVRPSILPGKSGLAVDDSRNSAEDRRSSFRASFKPPPRAESALGDHPDMVNGDDCGPLVKAPFDGSMRAWEAQIEIVLKEIYASIRDTRLPLFGAESSPMPNPSGGLSVMSMLKRTPSVLSKAPSETTSMRGRVAEPAKPNMGGRWSSKSRSRPRVGLSSSRTSFEDNNSIWSPTESSATWSRYSLGRTHTSMSMDSFNSSYPRGDYQQSIGFANALSHAIIREDNPITSPSVLSDDLKGAQLLEDESLELAGPPWIKEGMVTHKHHLDGMDRKAKDRNWTEVFAVVQKGQMSLFSFTPNKSLRNKSRSRGNLPKGAVVGGGNWQENATTVGAFSLRQALASTLPPPGYSRSRPYVWALSLPSGAVHLFQVGTPEICKEFVNTANYWSARLSTHPLVGGISNIEYGWSDAIINNPLVTAINESTGNLNGRPGTGTSSINKGHSRGGSAVNATARTSMQSRSSMRSSSVDHGRPGSASSGQLPGVNRHGKLPGDLITISEWSPPTQSMRPSNSGEREQLETLSAYVRNIEEELQQHNALRSPMLLAFTPRGHNAVRAMANWQRKSEYLLREIVKFRTYTDSLQAADGRKAEIHRERELARRAAMGEEVGSLGSGDEGEGKAAGLEMKVNGEGKTQTQSPVHVMVDGEVDADETIRTHDETIRAE